MASLNWISARVIIVVSLILAASAGPAAPIEEVTHTPQQPHSRETVTVTARVHGLVTNAMLEYQLVDPGKYIDLSDAAYKTNWISLAMNDAGKSGDAKAGDGIFTVVVPADLQVHR